MSFGRPLDIFDLFFSFGYLKPLQFHGLSVKHHKTEVINPIADDGL